MGSNLHCSATNCAFNKTGGCYASQIKVEGYDAAITPETYCDTFRDKDNFNMTNYHGNTSLLKIYLVVLINVHIIYMVLVMQAM